MIKSALISPDRLYRYDLLRIWNEDKPAVMFIGLNPSTADETKDDPTIRRCIGFARSWGYGQLIMGNLFALRSTKPAGLLSAADPVGPQNDSHLIWLGNQASMIVAAWWNGDWIKRVMPNRGKEIIQIFPNIHYLKINNDGVPAHPLYQKKSIQPIPLNQQILF